MIGAQPQLVSGGQTITDLPMPHGHVNMSWPPENGIQELDVWVLYSLMQISNRSGILTMSGHYRACGTQCSVVS